MDETAAPDSQRVWNCVTDDIPAIHCVAASIHEQ